MADPLIETMRLLKSRVKDLTEENSRLRAENSELQATAATLRKRAEEADTLRSRAELDAEYLAVSHKLASDPDTLIKARRHIAQLIRNIDRCLDMLRE